MFKRIIPAALGLVALSLFFQLSPAPRLLPAGVVSACAAGAPTAEGLLPSAWQPLNFSAGGSFVPFGVEPQEAPVANGKIEVRKVFIGTGVSNLDLQIDYVTITTVGPSGGTTGEQTYPSGSHTVSEDIICGDLSGYATNITCRSFNGFGPIVAQGYTTSLAVNLAANADVVCIITNVQIPQQCLFQQPFASVIVGTIGSDFINGTSGNDMILALGGGLDTVNAGSGNDCVLGGAGTDVIDLGDGDDVAFGESGSDNIRGGIGSDYIDGGAGTDTINGGPDTDICTGELLTNCEPNAPV